MHIREICISKSGHCCCCCCGHCYRYYCPNLIAFQVEPSLNDLNNKSDSTLKRCNSESVAHMEIVINISCSKLSSQQPSLVLVKAVNHPV
jgi:hypothetical protein